MSLENVEWDYIVLGAGTAGCVLANRLASSSKKYKVLVLEAGHIDKSIKIKIPALQPLAFGRKNFDWCYNAEPDLTRDNYKPIWTAGKVWGGSSSLNGMIYIRGQKGIGYLAQEASVFRKLSVENNILSVLQMTNLPKDLHEV